MAVCVNGIWILREPADPLGKVYEVVDDPDDDAHVGDVPPRFILVAEAAAEAVVEGLLVFAADRDLSGLDLAAAEC